MLLEYNIRDISGLVRFSSPVSIVRNLNIFWISVILYSAGFTFSSSLYSLAIVFQGLQIIGIAGLIFSMVNLIEVEKLNVYFLIIFIIYILWQVFFVARGDFHNLNKEEVKAIYLSGNYGLICNLVPFVALLPVSLINIKKLFDASIILSFLYIVFTFVFFQDLLNTNMLNSFSREALEVSVKFLAFPICFILLTFELHSNKRKLFASLVFSLIILFSINQARRGLLLMCGIVAIFAFIFYVFRSSKKLGWALAIVYILILGYQFYTIDYSLSNLQFFNNIFEKGLENTRSYVENCFYSSMSTMDWIIGKGYNEGYLCPGIDESIFNDRLRKIIETDYLQLVLNGGLVNLILLMAIILPAVFLGFFYSSNMFSKKAATWILIWVFFLYPSNAYTVSVFHISIWLMIAICYNKKFRELSDQTIINYFTRDIRIKTNGKA